MKINAITQLYFVTDEKNIYKIWNYQRHYNFTEDRTRLDILQSHIGVILIKIFCLWMNLYVSYIHRQFVGAC